MAAQNLSAGHRKGEVGRAKNKIAMRLPAKCDQSDTFVSSAIPNVIDRSVHAAVARFTGGLSPGSLMATYMDWAVHLASAPGKQMQLVQKAVKKSAKFSNHLAYCMAHRGEHQLCIEPLPQDKRFAGEAWQELPYNAIYQSFLLTQQWWHNATTDVRGVSKRHEDRINFMARQVLDVFSPSNFLMTNPEVAQRTIEERGQNLVRGMQNFIEDIGVAVSGAKPIGAEKYIVGHDVGVTPGKVVYRNRLIELIQYAPATGKVRPEPILIVPAWIMKYYILDLSPENSLVKYLVGQGYTVFMISWKNPDKNDRDLSMEDYLELGVMDALDAVSAIVPDARVHATGYCLGGTLLSIASAAMGRDGDDRLASLSLFAAQTDFAEAGELTLFIDESELAYLEDMMWDQGYLDTRQMAGAFQILRSNDLIWSRNLTTYLMGERLPMNDLMAWNADATRMPYRMHSEYLHKLFLENDLAQGRFLVSGQPVALTDIHLPVFAVGTERDHVAPWRSAYKIHQLTDTEVTFVLTSGGHNAGIVSEPGHQHRHYHIRTTARDDRYADPDRWLSEAPQKAGSWWTEWVAWLDARSGLPVAPPEMGAPDAGYAVVCAAPGAYVHQE